MKILENPRPDEVGATPHEFLEWLGGPAAIRIPGRDPSRCRAVVAMLHGNEPSGLAALRAWLVSGAESATAALVLVPAVEAAREPPGFAHRMLPGRRDLNRCFRPPYDDDDGAIAARMLELLREHRCESLVDLHNNTGRNPPYGVLTRTDPERLALVSCFTRRCVHTRIRLGTLLEAIEEEIPSASIECGQSGDPEADRLALRGLQRYLGAGETEPDGARTVELFSSPIRVCVAPGQFVAFGRAPHTVADLTLLDDVDRFNFEVVEPGAVIGWIREGADWPLLARDAGGRERSHDFFSVADGVLRTRREMIPIMMTTDPTVATQDCLFYLVDREEVSHSRP